MADGSGCRRARPRPVGAPAPLPRPCLPQLPPAAVTRTRSGIWPKTVITKGRFQGRPWAHGCRWRAETRNLCLGHRVRMAWRKLTTWQNWRKLFTVLPPLRRARRCIRTQDGRERERERPRCLGYDQHPAALVAPSRTLMNCYIGSMVPLFVWVLAGAKPSDVARLGCGWLRFPFCHGTCFVSAALLWR